MGGMKNAIVLVAVILMSGCASANHRHQVQRLQSQFGLLDERVTQLEQGVSLSAGERLSSGYALPSESTSTGQDVSLGTLEKRSWTKPPTKEVQQALTHAGFYHGAIDGKKGPMTRTAIQEFQRLHGLKEDGIVGKQTWAKLQPYLTAPSTGSPSPETIVLK